MNKLEEGLIVFTLLISFIFITIVLWLVYISIFKIKKENITEQKNVEYKKHMNSVDNENDESYFLGGRESSIISQCSKLKCNISKNKDHYLGKCVTTNEKFHMPCPSACINHYSSQCNIK